MVPIENPSVGKGGLGATFVSGTLRFLKNGHPEEMWSRMKLRKWERTGWERRSFLKLCGFSKIVIQSKFGPEGKSASGRERAGSDFVSGTLRLLKNGPENEIWSRRKIRKW